MVRGRRQNPDAPPSRQLEISRAFRQRRAKDLEELRGQLARLEEENGQLRKENEQLKALGLWGKKTGTDATPSAAGTPCVRCSMLQTELNRMAHAARHVFERAESFQEREAASLHAAPKKRKECRTNIKSQDDSCSTVVDTDAAATTSAACTPNSGAQRATAKQLHRAPFAATPPSPHDQTTSQHMWEQSVLESGGDPSKCCAGFFECDSQGTIQVASPPHL